MDEMIDALIAHDPVTNAEAESILRRWIRDHPEIEDAEYWAEESVGCYFSRILEWDGE